MNWKRIFRIGSGCGIEIRGDALRIVAIKSRPAGVTVLGVTEIQGFRERPPREWGTECATFLKEHGLAHLAATVALPREEVIVRQIWLPPASGKELAAAVRYQLDTLHPFAEDEVCHAFGVLREPADEKGQVPVAVVMAEKARVDAYADLFEAAGISVAAFTVTEAALAAALRLRWETPPVPLVFTHFRDGSLEVYGEAQERPQWSARFDSASMAPARALQVAAAELRLEPSSPASLVICGEAEEDAKDDGTAHGSPLTKLREDVPPGYESRAVEEVLPTPLAVPVGFDVARRIAVFAAALESACPRLGWRANLLPVERRKSDSRWMYAPTAALLIGILLVGAALAIRPLMQDRRYLAAIESETARLETIVREVEQAEQQNGNARRRLARLQDIAQRVDHDLATVRELSQLIPDQTWLHSLEINDTGAVMSGEGPAAASLLGVLDGSSTLTNAAFSASLQKTENGERFQIAAKRRAPQSQGSPVAQAAPPPAPADVREASGPAGALDAVSGESVGGGGE